MTDAITALSLFAIGTNIPVAVTGSGPILAYFLLNASNPNIVVGRGIEHRFELGVELMKSHPFRIIDSNGELHGVVDTTGVTVTFPPLL